MNPYDFACVKSGGRRIACVGVLMLATSAAAAPGAEADPLGPSPEEVELLEHVNRLRADPAAEAFAISSMGRRALDIPEYVDLDLFIDEMLVAESAPPLVFDASLCTAARRHSRYMIAHGQGHEEDPALEHFTGRRYSDRMQAAGFDAYLSGENVFIAALNPHQAHAAFVIDWGVEGDPGGMQPGRGHRVNLLSPRFRRVGIGAVDWHEEAFGRDLVSVTQGDGTGRLGRRCIGGVVYTDRNRNGRYDAGEGEGGVTLVASDGSETTTWESGAYTLLLKGNREVSVDATAGELSRRFEVPEGTQNVKRDWVLPPRPERNAVRRALEAVLAADEGNAASVARARLGLWMVVQDYAGPESMAERIAAEIEGVGEEVAASRQRVLDALGDVEGIAAARGLIQSERRAYAGTSLGDWYGQAEVARRVIESATRRAADLAQGADPQRRRRALRVLYEQLEGVTIPELRAVAAAALRP